MIRFTFKPVEKSQRELIHKWLKQDYIREWIHGKGLQNTLAGLERFFEGPAPVQHWIAYDGTIPFAYLLTSKVHKDADDEYAAWCQEEGEAITLDIFICDKNYMGKGLAVPLIRAFLVSEFPHVSEVLIDPEVSNERAVHVYQKAGFEIFGTYIAPWHPVPHFKMRLSTKKLHSISEQ